jgi:hypothetical protein
MTDAKPHVTLKVPAAPEAAPIAPRVLLIGKRIRTALEARAPAKASPRLSKSRHGQKPRTVPQTRYGRII